MAKFRYYVTDLNSGSLRGTNKGDVANSFAMLDDFFVVDSETGMWLGFGDAVPVEDMEQES